MRKYRKILKNAKEIEVFFVMESGMRDAGCGMQDAGCRMQDAGCQKGAFCVSGLRWSAATP